MGGQLSVVDISMMLLLPFKFMQEATNKHELSRKHVFVGWPAFD